MGTKKRRQFLETGIGARAGAAISQAGNACGPLRAGVARSDITTDAKGVLINDPLYAKALVLDDGRTKVAIIAMDVPAIGARGISRKMLDDVADDLLSYCS